MRIIQEIDNSKILKYRETIIIIQHIKHVTIL